MTLLSPHDGTASFPPRTGPTPWSTLVVALTATLGLSVVGWIVTVREMAGTMNMGVATPLGSFSVFADLWIAMMAAMMLPGTAPAVLRDARARGRLRTVPLFVGSYLAIWALVGLVVFALYRPHGTITAGVVVVGAGLYEFTPFKQQFRRRCHEEGPRRIRYGLSCVGSSIELMLMMVALGVMSVTWVSLIAVIGLGQKLLPARIAIDVPLALAIVGFGVVILVAPSMVPGLMPSM
jgi:predicted metal-binding membrane protein